MNEENSLGAIEGLELKSIDNRLVITSYARDLTFSYKGEDYFGEVRYTPNEGFEFNTIGMSPHLDFDDIEDFSERLTNMCDAQAEVHGVEDIHDD